MSLITLISDFGTTDYYVALLKAAIFRYEPTVTIIDISHDIKRHDIMEASFYLRSTYAHFPDKTIHLAAVNSFYDQKSELILIDHNNHYFIGPNNGLFSLIFPEVSADSVYLLAENITTFNQYDAVGSAIKNLGIHEQPSDFCFESVDFDRKISLQPVITSHQIRATIVHIDQFGNVIVNLDLKTFEDIRADRFYTIYYKSNDPITALASDYSDCMIGDVCAFFNTTGLLEIAINMGNAHELLNLNKNETIQINFG